MRAEIVRQIRPLVTPNTTVIAETGDSWFNGLQLKLPGGARFEIEMQWGQYRLVGAGDLRLCDGRA